MLLSAVTPRGLGFGRATLESALPAPRASTFSGPLGAAEIPLQAIEPGFLERDPYVEAVGVERIARERRVQRGEEHVHPAVQPVDHDGAREVLLDVVGWRWAAAHVDRAAIAAGHEQRVTEPESQIGVEDGLARELAAVAVSLRDLDETVPRAQRHSPVDLRGHFLLTASQPRRRHLPDAVGRVGAGQPRALRGV